MKKTVFGSSMILMAVGVGCSGEGSDFSAVEKTVVGTCGNCHDPAAFENLVGEIGALGPEVFTEERFPETMFPSSLTSQTTADLIAAQTPERDATIDPSAPDRQAWVLHLMHELELQLAGSPPSDFTSEEGFNTYNAGGDPPFGCEAIDRLGDFFDFDLPQQMPPPWTEAVLTEIDRTFTPLTEDDRQTLLETIESGLPEGIMSCFF
jgi:hypothetical protein